MDPLRPLLDDLEAFPIYGNLGEPYDPGLQGLVEFAAEVCETSISAVTVFEDDRQRFLAELGCGDVNLTRDEAFCAHAMLHDGLFEIPDARADVRFENNPLVVSPAAIRFYSGVAVRDRDGIPVATFCVIDARPRELTALQKRTLTLLARQAEARLEALRSLRALREERVARARATSERERLIVALELERHRFRTLLDGSPAFAALLCGDDLTYEYANEAHAAILGGREVVGRRLVEVVPEAVAQGFVDLLRQVVGTGRPYRASNVPFTLTLPRGRTRQLYLDVLYQAYREADGTISGVFTQGVDVTEHVLAQKALADKSLSH